MIRFTCPACRADYQLEDKWAGHRVKCPKCGEASAVSAAAFDLTEPHTPGKMSKHGDIQQAGFPNCVAAANSLTGLFKVAVGMLLAAMLTNAAALIFLLSSAVRTEDYSTFTSAIYFSLIAWFSVTPVLAFGYFCVRILAACGELIMASAQRFAREKIRGDGQGAE